MSKPTRRARTVLSIASFTIDMGDKRGRVMGSGAATSIKTNNNTLPTYCTSKSPVKIVSIHEINDECETRADTVGMLCKIQML